jgi:hypothetical protein
VHKGLEGMWKEAVVAGFEALSQHVRRDRGKPHKKTDDSRCQTQNLKSGLPKYEGRRLCRQCREIYN